MNSIFLKDGLPKKLFDSSGFKQALTKVSNYYQEHKEKIPYHECSDVENFYLETFQLITQIDEKLTELAACRYFISSYPGNLKISKVMTRHKYIVYHLEHYYIGIIALYDRVLKLVNHLCDLGLDDRDASHEVVVRHLHLGKELKDLLKKFHKATESIRKLQNRIKHKTGMSIDELSTPSLFEFVSLQTHRSDEEKLEHEELRLLAIYGYKKYISKKTKELKSNDEALRRFLEGLFQALEKPYERYLANLERGIAKH